MNEKSLSEAYRKYRTDEVNVARVGKAIAINRYK
ncbi:hypothetical protein SR1949_23880 [Sphaerospermopsis reniformis]|uniref:Uncharacterized protein n=1 Tax=Sphaerospermopsis reniformis TaxID=531300 RepID=A0A479ZWW2_9CYAN|nr:hypothetical protein SR1949_23880 [Sphaerospermopsis reniformis]